MKKVKCPYCKREHYVEENVIMTQCRCGDIYDIKNREDKK